MKPVTLSPGQLVMVVIASGLTAWAGVSFGLGWMSEGTHQRESQEMVDTALVPHCAMLFAASPGALAEFDKVSSYQRARLISEKVPKVGTASMDYRFTNACADAVADLQKKTAAAPLPTAKQ